MPDARIEVKPGSKFKNTKQIAMSPKIKEAFSKEIEKKMKRGILEKSKSPVTCKCFLVRKPDKVREDGTVEIRYRFVCSLIEVNRNVQYISAYTESITELQRTFAGQKFKCSSDILDAYFQIGIHEEDRKWLSFQTPNHGIVQFTRCPQGYSNGKFLLDDHLRTALAAVQPFHARFSDDCNVFGSDFDVCLKNMRDFLTQCRKYNITLSPSKTNLFFRVVNFAGFTILEDGMTVMPKHLKALEELKIPKTISEVRRVMGLLQFFAKFIPNFAHHSFHITKTMREAASKFTREIEWTKEADEALNYIRGKLIEGAKVSFPVFGDENRPFLTTTDSSTHHYGAALLQPDEKGELVLIDCFSHTISNPTEMARSPFRKEANALGKAVCVWEAIYSDPTTLKIFCIDSKSLFFMASSSHIQSTCHLFLESLKTLYAPALICWARTDHPFQKISDCLSRPFGDERVFYKSEWIKAFDLEEELEKVKNEEYNPELKKLATVLTRRQRKIEEEKKKLKDIQKEAENESSDTEDEEEELPTQTQTSEDSPISKNPEDQYNFTQEMLKSLTKPDIPDSNHKILTKFHAQCHFGTDFTHAIMKQANIPCTVKDIKTVISNCPDCKRFPHASMSPGAVPRILSLGKFPGHKVEVDLCGPFSKCDGMRFYLCCKDTFSDYVFIEPLPNKKPKTVVKALDRIFVHGFGHYPMYLRGDIGTEFVMPESLEYFREKNIIPDHCNFQQKNANSTERCHREFKTALKRMVHTKWTDSIKQVALFRNMARKPSLLGYPPFELFHGKTPPLQQALFLSTPNNCQLSTKININFDDFVEKREAFKQARYNIKMGQLKMGTKVSIKFGETTWRPGFIVVGITKDVITVKELETGRTFGRSPRHVRRAEHVFRNIEEEDQMSLVE